MTRNLKQFVGKRTLVVITIIVTTTLGFLVFHKPESYVIFHFPIKDLPTRKLLVKAIQPLQSKIEMNFGPNRAVIREQVATDSFVDLADCQIYFIVLYEIPGWFSSQPPHVLQHHIAIDVKNNKSWNLLLEDSSFDQFIIDQCISVKEEKDLQNLSQLFKGMHWISKSSSNHWHEIDPHTWELSADTFGRKTYFFIVHTGKDDKIDDIRFEERQVANE